jgi:uncharacterized SAM-binding protein YcdF (DUF218 family)
MAPSRLRQARRLRYALWGVVVASALVAGLLLWGASLLIADDPLPPHVDSAVVLQGSVLGQKARVAGAIRVLREGKTSRILVSVPRESYWGQSVIPIASADIRNRYGSEVASHVDFCETDNVDSTEDEAASLAQCVTERGLNSITVVTSDYHTRRAGIIWRRTLRQRHSPVHLWIHAVPDPEFHASGWWRERRSSKIWLFEFTKLLWTLVER